MESGNPPPVAERRSATRKSGLGASKPRSRGEDGSTPPLHHSITPPVRLGLIGLGGIGQFYAKELLGRPVPRLRLAAVCSRDPARRALFPDLPGFAESGELIRSGAVDAVLIATPHYAHTAIGIDALRQGLHVLVEKPISVHKADAERLLAARRSPRQVLAAMFQMRTYPLYARIKRMIERGELGAVQRLQWTVTDWFRPESYYASGGWRATWKGEGGGVLLNQCPHNLDLLQWFLGQPSAVRAFCRLGRYHDIEVEDEVSAYLEWPGGATGVFITTTGEAPGTNRLEIAGDRGRLVAEDGKLLFTRNRVPASEFSRSTKERFGRPPCTSRTIAVRPPRAAHRAIFRNFAAAILDGAPLIAPAEEGLRSVELANAMLYSTLTHRTIALPLDGQAYERTLRRLIRESRFAKKTAEADLSDMGTSFR